MKNTMKKSIVIIRRSILSVAVIIAVCGLAYY